jgi:hypothetical protein
MPAPMPADYSVAAPTARPSASFVFGRSKR